ncbi:MAG: hypothetical protein IJ493_01835 [Clostridia bacterium]|nr:hypothetical protein [Clostridia bacterium]
MKILAIFALLLCLLTGCEQADEPVETARSTVYRSEKVALPENFSPTIGGISTSGGRVCVPGWFTGAKTVDGQYRQIFSVDETGGNPRLDDLRASEDGMRVGGITYMPDGGRYVVEYQLGDACYERMSVLRYDAEGAVAASYDCETLFGLDISRLKVDLAGDGGFSIVGVFEEEQLVIVSSTGIAVIEGESQRRIDSRYEITGAVMSRGRLIVIYEKNKKSAASYVDLEAGEFGGDLTLPEGISGRLMGLEGYDLGVQNSTGVYGLRETESGWNVVEVCDFVASDVVGSMVYGFAVLTEDCFYALTRNEITRETELWRMTRLDNPPEKQVLTIAALMDYDAYLQQAVVDFNRTSDTYRFEIVSYTAVKENGAFDTQTASSRFNADIAAGNIPDVVMLPAGMPTSAADYARQGLFCDLYGLMTDAEQANLLESVREYGETDGRLCYLAVQSTATTQVCDGRWWESTGGGELTLERVMNLLESEDVRLADNPRTLLRDTLQYSLHEFIDGEGKTSFTSEKFLRFLDLYKRAADGEFDHSVETEKDDDRAVYREGKLRISQLRVDGLYRYYSARKNYETDSLKVLGYPGENGNTTLLSPNLIWGITQACEAKEAAWALLKIRISDDYVMNYSRTLPLVTYSALDVYLSNEMEKYYFLCHEGRGYTSGLPIDAADGEAVMGKPGEVVRPTAADAAMLRSMAESARTLPDLHREVMLIISEELWNFAQEARYSAPEIAEIINNRVSIVYNERK